MTYENAKAAALAAGFDAADITPAVIKLYGYEVGDPIANLQPVVARTDDEVKGDLALLQEEAKSNAVLSNVIGRVMPLLLKGAGMLLALMLMFSLSGCATTAAKKALAANAASVQALNEQHLAMEEMFIQDFHDKEMQRIDALYDDAIKSVTVSVQVPQSVPIKVRTFDAAGKVTETTEMQQQVATQQYVKPDVAAKLMDQKLSLYAQLERNVFSWRQKQALISKNAANARAYSDALQAYFDQKAVDMEQLSKASSQFTDFIDKFIKKSKPAAATVIQ